LKEQQRKQISDERKAILMRKKLESADSTKSFPELRRDYLLRMITNVSQIGFYSTYTVYFYLNPETLGSETIPILGLNASLTLISIATIMLALGTFFNYRHFKRIIKSESRAYCLFTSISVAECLESGDRVRAAFFAEKLFEVFPLFARNTKVQVGPWKTDLAKILEYDVEETYLSRKAIGSLIRLEKIRTLSSAFYSLADQLFSKDAPNNYDAFHESLHKIVESTKKYRRKELTFFEKHPNLKNTLAELSEYTKLITVLILSFILWLTFGYGK
jgi:hypothetical protein